MHEARSNLGERMRCGWSPPSSTPPKSSSLPSRPSPGRSSPSRRFAPSSPPRERSHRFSPSTMQATSSSVQRGSWSPRRIPQHQRQHPAAQIPSPRSSPQIRTRASEGIHFQRHRDQHQQGVKLRLTRLTTMKRLSAIGRPHRVAGNHKRPAMEQIIAAINSRFRAEGPVQKDQPSPGQNPRSTLACAERTFDPNPNSQLKVRPVAAWEKCGSCDECSTHGNRTS